MTVNIVGIIVLIVLASLAWWANEQLNNVPGLKPLVKVIIVVVSILLLLQQSGLIGSSSSIILK